MCMYCKNDTLVESTTTHVVNYKNCTIIIKNVPCRECSQCGCLLYTSPFLGFLLVNRIHDSDLVIDDRI